MKAAALSGHVGAQVGMGAEQWVRRGGTPSVTGLPSCRIHQPPSTPLPPPPCSAASTQVAVNGEGSLGARVAVWWDGDQTYFEGHIAHWDAVATE